MTTQTFHTVQDFTSIIDAADVNQFANALSAATASTVAVQGPMIAQSLTVTASAPYSPNALPGSINGEF